MSYDIIGDVHGHADRLEQLLTKLGYRHHGGAWRNPSRTAIFVGDLIDRGPGQLRTLEIVRDMVEAGSARMVMGNHEFNAIAWATVDPEDDGRYLRARHGEKGDKNRHQHAAFLAEIGLGSDEHRFWIEWFMDLPLWMEEPGFRVVHACWSPRHAAQVAPLLAEGRRLTPDLLVAASRQGDPAYEAVETLLKGAEARLPVGVTFADKDGHQRDAIRLRWWNPELTTYSAAYIGPAGVDVPDVPIPTVERIPEPDRPTFIGHYWLDPSGPIAPLSSKVACVDYSVARGGPLVAYRFEGERELLDNRFFAA